MTTERFSFTGVAGTDHYLGIFNAAGQVFDWSDNTFKALASATTKAASSSWPRCWKAWASAKRS